MVFGTVGRLGEIEGTDILVDAAQLVLPNNGKARFKIADDAPAELISRLVQKGRSQSVNFVGWTDDVDGFLDSVDVFYLPAKW